MVRAKEQTHDVRNEKADITDCAADRNGEPRKNGCSDVNDKTHTADIDAEVHRFLFAGEEQIQIGGGGVDSARSGKKANAEHPSQTRLQGTGEIAHEPESHSAEIPVAERGHEEHDDRGKKGRADDAGEEQGGAVDLALALAQEIDRGDGGCGAERCAVRSEDGSKPDRERQVRLRDEGQNGAKRGAAGYA